MPFEDLLQVIETLKERIEAHRQSLQSNETRTRMALIDPLLRALGWDTEDPALVLPEYEASGGRADYALLGGADKPAAVIEAKKLGESLANHRGQMVTYATMDGIPYAGLTDGDHWEFYKVFDAKPLDERRLLDVSIANDAPHECALKLLLLWHPNLASSQPLQPPLPPKPPQDDPPPPLPEGWVALTELDPAGAQAPSTIRFPDGHEAIIKFWKSLLVETGTWLDRKGVIPRGASLPSGRKRYILHRDSKHQTGNGFRSPVQLPQSGVYLETHDSAEQVVAHATKLLRQFGQDPATVYVRPRT